MKIKKMWKGKKQLEQLFRSTQFTQLGEISIAQQGESYIVSSTHDENSLRQFMASMLSNIDLNDIKIHIMGNTNNKRIFLNKNFHTFPNNITNHSYKYVRGNDITTYIIQQSREQTHTGNYDLLETFTASRVTGNMLIFPKPEYESMSRLMSVLITSGSVRKIFIERNLMNIGIPIMHLQDVMFDNSKVTFSTTDGVTMTMYRATPIPGPQFS